MRKLTGSGKPRCLQGGSAPLHDLIFGLWSALATMGRFLSSRNAENAVAASFSAAA